MVVVVVVVVVVVPGMMTNYKKSEVQQYCRVGNTVRSRLSVPGDGSSEEGGYQTGGDNSLTPSPLTNNNHGSRRMEREILNIAIRSHIFSPPEDGGKAELILRVSPPLLT